MGRIRTLKPEFFQSRSLAKLDPLMRLTFAGLWCQADDAGRGVADESVLKGALWPKDKGITDEVVLDHLFSLAETGHIELYEVDEDVFFHVVKWEKHQSAAYRTGKSKHPAPADGRPVTRPRENSQPVVENHDDEISRPVVENHQGWDGSGEDTRGEISAPGVSLELAIRSYNPKGAARQDDLWDALCHELGLAQTDTEKTVRGKTRKQLAALNVTPAQVHERCVEYRRRWPEMSLTDSALLKHWSSLAEAQVVTGPMNAGTAALLKIAGESARRRSAS